MAVLPRTTLSLFSGIGALDLAIGRVFPDARCLCFVEREAYACAVLAARMEDGSLDAAPIWGDVTTLPTEHLRGRVDMVAGGFPCQDLSLAGKRAGIEGERSGLFFDLLRTVRDIRPRYVFLENVAAITSGRTLDAVLGGLADLGLDAEWGCLRASDVGAPHGRNRWWCLAWDRNQLADPGGSSGVSGAERARWQARPDAHRSRSMPAVAYTDSGSCGFADGHATVGGWAGDAQQTRLGRVHVEYANGSGLEGRRLRRGGCPDERIARTTGRPSNWPPGPDDRDGWNTYLAAYPDLAPAIESEVRGRADGTNPRVDQLRALGNAVVPQQAEAALRLLWLRAFGELP